MQKLVIKNTLKSPSIDFNPETGIFEMSGVSLIENTLDFYRPILKWLEEYLKTPCQSTTFVFKLKYSNTSSLQFIYDIINLIYLEHNKKTVLSIIWYYISDDIDMKEVGEDYQDSFDINFTFNQIEV
ncbi:MAG: DUF1987 domain-containing protein [Bacteroidetes bacterium]|nr:DUF1987 domain-containing protein [Bacteroidota bacterium]